jgi:poly-gamma-glutamate synthesis protein (capsule biosynthesis protein)
MKRWQIGVIIVLLAASAWAVVSYHPGTVIVLRTATPVPSPTPDSRPVTLLFTGDIMLSRSVGDTMKAKNDWTWPFARIASVTAAADITFGNLETTISTGGAKNGCTYCFRADPKSVAGLLLAGFDVLSVANNHMWDYGPQAFTDTLSYLAVNDISAVGGGRNADEAGAPVVRTVRGTRVAYLAFTDILPASATALPDRAGINTWNEQRMREQVAQARTMADVVVVSFHTGTEYELIHNAMQERIYHAIIDAGADLVIGTHPHVVQDIEQYNGKWIAYSLGNFVFDQNWSDATRLGMMLSVTVRGWHIVDVTRIPVDISKDYQVSLHVSGTTVR